LFLYCQTLFIRLTCFSIINGKDENMVNEQRICAEFTHQTAISSPSFHEAEMAAYLSARFKHLGGVVEFDAAGEKIGAASGNLIVRFPGTKTGEPLLLCAHMDTVTPADDVRPVLKDGIFTSAGDTILGGDDKTGIVAIIEMLEVVKERNIPHVPLEIVITVCEEQGLLGAKHLDFSALNAARGLALDTSGRDIVINRAPAANRFEIDIFGLEAHAGICPEQGISAIQIAARAIAKMPLGRIDEETTANIGTIHGGQASNIIPASTRLHGEVRSHDLNKLREQTELIVTAVEEEVDNAGISLQGKSKSASMALELKEDYPPMQVADEAPIVQLVCAAGEALQRPQSIRAAGGGSDANIFNSHGIEMVIIATGMTNVHTINEFVTVEDLVATGRLLVEIIKRA
jgi:tripeptide aminopeptidase